MRIRQNIAGEPIEPDGLLTLIETVICGLRPPEIESAVALLASWTAPGIGDQLVESVEGTDAIASRLNVDIWWPAGDLVPRILRCQPLVGADAVSRARSIAAIVAVW